MRRGLYKPASGLEKEVKATKIENDLGGASRSCSFTWENHTHNVSYLRGDFSLSVGLFCLAVEALLSTRPFCYSSSFKESP
ncbi:hypothetical protein L6164_018821 [Bauhinia variegata]|uniref:Uncharacterized protein n=1 Tax=Bauhinia variegata TaxID=167791 RepID=A0ACB9ND55_BAUVA|nr:hypothetical protein L6164_018821 [Bauhinia variegata]